MVHVRQGINGGLRESNVISKKSSDIRHQTQNSWQLTEKMKTKTQWLKTEDAPIKWWGQEPLLPDKWHKTKDIILALSLSLD